MNLSLTNHFQHVSQNARNIMRLFVLAGLMFVFFSCQDSVTTDNDAENLLILQGQAQSAIRETAFFQVTSQEYMYDFNNIDIVQVVSEGGDRLTFANVPLQPTIANARSENFDEAYSFSLFDETGFNLGNLIISGDNDFYESDGDFTGNLQVEVFDEEADRAGILTNFTDGEIADFSYTFEDEESGREEGSCIRRSAYCTGKKFEGKFDDCTLDESECIEELTCYGGFFVCFPVRFLDCLWANCVNVQIISPTTIRTPQQVDIRVDGLRLDNKNIPWVTFTGG